MNQESAFKTFTEEFVKFRDFNVVGQLYVKVVTGKELSGKPYCRLQLDNVLLRTDATSAAKGYIWDQDFKINVYDVTSKLYLKVFNRNSLISSLRSNSIGSVLIPLLRIRNGEMRWYCLKKQSKRTNVYANNCPRVQLKMMLYWHPIKASLKVFKPQEVKHDTEPRHFNVEFVYKNMQFTRDIFLFFTKMDEGYKFLFEWDSREFSCLFLFWWLFFWYYFRMWATPLLLLTPFIYFWIFKREKREESFMREYTIEEDSDDDDSKENIEKSFSRRLYFIQEMTISTTDAIEFTASLTEKLYNLASLKVPFLSYLAMFLLVMTSVAFYFIPFNYIMMIFGLYKFLRKCFDPERKRNNDIMDFFSRIPDNKEWRCWNEIDFREIRASSITGKRTSKQFKKNL